MSTPQRDEYVTFSYDSETLMAGSKAIDCFDPSQLLRPADSRGDNRVVPGQPGAAVRPHVRGELLAELRWRLMGSHDDDNDPVPAGLWRATVLEHLDEVVEFFEGADGRAVDVVYTAGEVESDPATVVLKAWGPLRWPAPQVCEFTMLVSVPSGRLTFEGSGEGE